MQRFEANANQQHQQLLNQMNEQNRIADERAKEADKRLKQVGQTITRLEGENKSLTARLDRAAADAKKVEEASAEKDRQTQIRHDKAIQDLRAEHANRDASLSQLQSRLQQAETLRARQQTAVDELRLKSSALERQLTASNRDLADAKAAAEGTAKQLKAATDGKSDAATSSRISDLERRIASLNAERAANRQKIEQGRSTVDAMKRHGQTLKAQLDSRQVAMTKLKNELDRARSSSPPAPVPDADPTLVAEMERVKKELENQRRRAGPVNPAMRMTRILPVTKSRRQSSGQAQRRPSSGGWRRHQGWL